MKPAKNYYKDLLRDLADSKEASAYLNAALEAGDKKAFLLALRNVIKARGGMMQFARRTKINRVSLYKMLSEKGNPGFENILFLLHAAGVKLQAAPVSFQNRPRKAA